MARFDLTDEEWSVIAQLSKTRPTAINGTFRKSVALKKRLLRHQNQTFRAPPASSRNVRKAVIQHEAKKRPEWVISRFFEGGAAEYIYPPNADIDVRFRPQCPEFLHKQTVCQAMRRARKGLSILKRIRASNLRCSPSTMVDSNQDLGAAREQLIQFDG